MANESSHKRAWRNISQSSQRISKGNVRTIPAVPIIQAYELLARQPLSLVGLSQQQRNQIVVSAICDESGLEHVISRIGDNEWDLSTDWATQNVCRGRKNCKWLSGIPLTLLDDAKAAIYVWYKNGRPGFRPPTASSVGSAIMATIPTLRYLASHGVSKFNEIRPIHINNYILSIKEGFVAGTIHNRLQIFDLAWIFSGELLFPPGERPFGDKSIRELSGLDEPGDDGDFSGKAGLTPVIPRSQQEVIFNFAESVLESAAEVFKKRDAGFLDSCGRELALSRDSVLYLLQITSGMRNSETMGIKRGSWRIEEKGGITYHWVATIEHKTRKGLVEFLVPPEAISALEILEEYAKPFQARLAREIRTLKRFLWGNLEGAAAVQWSSSGIARSKALQRLAEAEASVDNLFLTQHRHRKDVNGELEIVVMSEKACNVALNRIAQSAGSTWKICNSQCRRTFAWNVANSRLGRKGLVFIKWQLKHKSINTTQLYAANPRQDRSLYEEFYEEMVAARAEVLESWFDADQNLSGGAGEKIVQARAIAVKDKASILRFTAETVTIRSTGHSWCLSEQGACVGEGIYEAIRCGNCSSAVIDESYAETWQHIHRNNLELAKVENCGPAIEQRAKREIAMSEKVLTDLGISIPS